MIPKPKRFTYRICPVETEHNCIVELFERGEESDSDLYLDTVDGVSVTSSIEVITHHRKSGHFRHPNECEFCGTSKRG